MVSFSRDLLNNWHVSRPSFTQCTTIYIHWNTCLPNWLKCTNLIKKCESLAQISVMSLGNICFLRTWQRNWILPHAPLLTITTNSIDDFERTLVRQGPNSASSPAAPPPPWTALWKKRSRSTPAQISISLHLEVLYCVTVAESSALRLFCTHGKQNLSILSFWKETVIVLICKKRISHRLPWLSNSEGKATVQPPLWHGDVIFSYIEQYFRTSHPKRLQECTAQLPSSLLWSTWALR